MDFGRLPPEINSARMYAGPGALSMLVAAVAWSRLAAELHNTAAGYKWVTSSLAGGAWDGPSAASMVEAAAPYVAWLTATAAQAEQAAAQARAAAGAFDVAHTMTVPPPLITANRTQLRSLAAKNSLAQSSPAIAETEAGYEEMWARDAAAMYNYAAASAAASRVTPFTSPPVTVDPAGLTRQGVAVAKAAGSLAGAHAQEILSAGPQLIEAVPPTLQRLASPSWSTWSPPWSTSSPSGLSSLSQLSSLTVPASIAMYAPYPMNSVMSAIGSAGTGGLTGNAAAAAVQAVASDLAGAVGSGADASGSTGAVDAGPAVLAGVGGATRVGRLSVPGAWSAAASVRRPTTSGIGLPVVLWRTSRTGGPAGVRVTPIAATAGRRVGPATASRLKVRRTVVPRPPAGG